MSSRWRLQFQVEKEGVPVEQGDREAFQGPVTSKYLDETILEDVFGFQLGFEKLFAMDMTRASGLLAFLEQVSQL